MKTRVHPIAFIAIAAALLVCMPTTGRADEPQRSWLDPIRYADGVCDAVRGMVGRVKRIEAVEMITAILSGSQMGPGEGWFHPGQSRYDWKWLAVRYDKNGAGAITRKDFTGPAELFDRLDRNRAGVLKPEDFDWSNRSAYVRDSGMARMIFSRIDRDTNGRISQEEWEAFFKQAAKGKDHLTPDDLREALFPPPLKPDTSEKGPSPLVLLRGLVEGEIGSMHEGPALNAKAPDFTLRTEDGKKVITLSDFRDKKPVVLIFGSFT
jgi:hypothetical protein